MQIIDSHIHIGLSDFCDVNGINFPQSLCNTYEEALSLMDKFNVERAVTLPVPHRLINTQTSNEYVYEAYMKHPDRFIPFCRIDENLEQNLKNGFKGAKLHMVYENLEIKNIKENLRILEDYCVPLIIHAKFAKKISQIREILKIAPNLNIILAHMGRGNLYTSEQVIENALALKSFPNVYFETSTVGNVQTIVNVGEILSFDRVIFGSDYPFGKNYFGLKYDYISEIRELIEFLTISEAKKFFYNSIINLLCKSDSRNIKIRRAKVEDLTDILNIFEALTDEERKFLALDNKLSLIRRIIRTGRHCYVAVIDGEIVGFMRESGRPEGFSLLEELVTSPAKRNLGIAKSLLFYYHNAFPKSMVTTNAANKTMIHLCKKNGYIAENLYAKRIIHWKREVFT